MQLVIVLLALVSIAFGAGVPTWNTAYGYLTRFGIPEAERILKAEESINELEQVTRISGGVPAALGQYPYQAGIISEIKNTEGRGMCGGSLVSETKVLTAAHCWYDGKNQASKLTVVLGSVYLFKGGIRLETTDVQTHPHWSPLLIRNDIAMVTLPQKVALSDTVAPIALPSEVQAGETFVGAFAVASGYGITSNDEKVTTNQSLNHVRLRVITRAVCSMAFPFIIQESHLCTSGVGGVSTCGGDSGGPLVAGDGGSRILIGITSFGSSLGCQFGLPAAYTRVSSFLDFIKGKL
ncbi:unnamed protein product [Pieris macdunnoughi]|uniref:Peptidase S1 domain-containing protein n=1 Tax=Pieris macdunnoughi TaxID=345717 RepID=A0A821SBU7_9NEOP|nr:unnamed protein product [Pieris macdunnoughi]